MKLKEETLKKELCTELINSGIVHEYDIVKHSYTTQILSGNKKCVEKSNEMIALTTRGDCVGVCVKDKLDIKRYKNYISWRNNKGQYNTECNRASLPDDLSLTIPTSDITKVAEINGGGEHYVKNKKINTKRVYATYGVCR